MKPLDGWACGSQRLEPLVLQGVEVAPGGRRVLTGVTGRCEPGELCAIVGVNGVGKSSLLRVMAGLGAASVGDVMLAGKSVSAWRGKELGRRRAYMEQSSALEFDYSVLEVVMMGEYAWQSGWGPQGQDAFDRAVGYLEKVGCKEFAGKSVMRCSGGERQRVMLARVMATRAGWWLLDEPLASLDMKYQSVVMVVFNAHCRRGGGAVMVCHDLNWVMARCDKVMVCHDGGVVRIGTPDEVLTQELIHEVFGVRAEVVEKKGKRHVLHHSRFELG